MSIITGNREKENKSFHCSSAVKAGKAISILVSVQAWKDEAVSLTIMLFLIGKILFSKLGFFEYAGQSKAAPWPCAKA